MTSRYLLLLVVQAFVSSAGLLLMKLCVARGWAAVMGGRLFDAPVFGSVAGAGLYVASFALWLVILSKSQLSYAYPMSVGITLLATTAAGVLVLSESLTTVRVMGICLVVAGLLLVNQTSV